MFARLTPEELAVTSDALFTLYQALDAPRKNYRAETEIKKRKAHGNIIHEKII